MSTEEEREIIELIHLADTRRSEADINHLNRLVDVGDRIIAQRILLDGVASELEGELSPDFPETETV